MSAPQRRGAAVSPLQRRGACPALSAPMETGDGLLVRFAPEDAIAADDFIALCAAARTHGNGTIEITARGSLQVRGLTPRSAPLFARAVASLPSFRGEAQNTPSFRGEARRAEHPESSNHRQSLLDSGFAACAAPRNDSGVSLLVDPLPDDPDVLIDTTALARELRRAIADARLALAPKVSVILDGGGRLHLDALSADLRLRAIGPAQAPHLSVSVGGDAASAAPLGSIPPGAVADTVVRVLRAIASHGADARAADVLRREGVAAFRAACGVGATHASPLHTPAAILPPRPAPEPVGTHPLRDGTVALGIALPFGHAHADALAELAHFCRPRVSGDPVITERGWDTGSPAFAGDDGLRIAGDDGLGIGGTVRLRPAPHRVLLLIGIAPEDAGTLAAKLERLGFITQAGDPRRRIVACPGKGACASGLIAARALAAAIAPSLPPSNDIVHVSGCAKGCAHPAPAALTIVGTEHGCGIIERGDARALPSRHVAAADIVAESVRLAMNVPVIPGPERSEGTRNPVNLPQWLLDSGFSAQLGLDPE
jgi:precorrin-3B synthase